jgi:hypothetical protein
MLSLDAVGTDAFRLRRRRPLGDGGVGWEPRGVGWEPRGVGWEPRGVGWETGGHRLGDRGRRVRDGGRRRVILAKLALDVVCERRRRVR